MQVSLAVYTDQHRAQNNYMLVDVKGFFVYFKYLDFDWTME